MMEDYFAELDPNPPLEDDDRYDGIDDETFGVTKDDLSWQFCDTFNFLFSNFFQNKTMNGNKYTIKN